MKGGWSWRLVCGSAPRLSQQILRDLSVFTEWYCGVSPQGAPSLSLSAPLIPAWNSPIGVYIWIWFMILSQKRSRFRKDVVHLSLNLVLNLPGWTAPGMNLCHHQCKGESSCSDGAVLIVGLSFRLGLRKNVEAWPLIVLAELGKKDCLTQHMKHFPSHSLFLSCQWEDDIYIHTAFITRHPHPISSLGTTLGKIINSWMCWWGSGKIPAQS